MSEKYWKLGILGWPLGYSLSPLMHTAALKACGLKGEYREIPVKPEDLDRWLKTEVTKFDGFNVTIPHKTLVATWCKPRQGREVDFEAQLMGSVNTVSIRNGMTIGYSTDGEGFLAPLTQRSHLQKLAGATVVLLGAGGAGRAIGHALVTKTRIKQLFIWNRHFDKAKHLMSKASLALEVVRIEGPFQCSVGVVTSLEQLPIEESQMVINATSLGMKETGEEIPDVVLNRLNSSQTAYDIVYSPRDTKFIRVAGQKGCSVITGDQMLAAQGAEAFRIWTRKTHALDGRPIVEVMQETLDKAQGKVVRSDA